MLIRWLLLQVTWETNRISPWLGGIGPLAVGGTEVTEQNLMVVPRLQARCLMITRPEHYVEHEMVLGDPRRTPHGQQYAVHCDRGRAIWLSASGQVPGRGPRSRRNCASTWLEDARRTSAYVRPTTRSRLRRCLFDGGVKNETNMVLDYALLNVWSSSMKNISNESSFGVMLGFLFLRCSKFST